MHHVILTCCNHTNLRWSCKEVAWSDRGDGTGYYNGSRNIFFMGEPSGKGLYADKSGLDCTTYFPEREMPVVHECKCPASDLRLAPENALLRS